MKLAKLILLTFIISMLLFSAAVVQAQDPNLHPTFPMLDEYGVNVLESGKPVDTMNTCKGCHDTEYIVNHSYHSDVGLNSYGDPGSLPGSHAWDTSPGWYGQWNPLVYRYLSPIGDERLDLGTPEWVQTLGYRHAGGGPAVTSPTGEYLPTIAQRANDSVTNIQDANGEQIPWDWYESGVVQMDCFLCHIPEPNHDARVDMLQSGDFKWANTATLLGSGLVEKSGEHFTWNPDAFDEDGNLAPNYILMQDPKDENCGLCHGIVHTDNETPLIISEFGVQNWSTATTGQIFSPQRLFRSGLNLENKNDMSRAWDIHAERAVSCVDCHGSTNNPVYFEGTKSNELAHLIFDPRRVGVEDYLHRPSHQFAKGNSLSNLAPVADNTMRTCDGCHDPNVGHNWLPYPEAHFATVGCETCHIPEIHAPAFQQLDWTVLNDQSLPGYKYRGANGDPNDINTLISGYKPALLPKQQPDSNFNQLMPYNLLTAWYWVADNPTRPVRQLDLEQVYLDENGNYQADILSAFDENGDGLLTSYELRLDNEAKTELIQGKLSALGLENPHIVAESQPYDINHGTINGDLALKDCTECHSQNSRAAAEISLASYQPGGVAPVFFGDEKLAQTGEFIQYEDGSVSFKPDVSAQGYYIFGHSNVWWIDLLGVLAFVGTFLGILVHGGLRIVAAMRNPQSSHHKTKRIYMYTMYERLWHWLQAAAIFALIFTGLIIHKPDIFGMFDFKYAVQVHNVLGFILFANALFAVFYNLASGEIRQYIPQPRGYFNAMIEQATFYLSGIFKGAEHPFEKSAKRKLNPLQQIVYFGILNALLPLQVITGIIIWGMQKLPNHAEMLGGLPLLAPIHSLVAWLFATFIVMHIYLTTTGHTPMAGIKSMIDGWDDIELHEH